MRKCRVPESGQSREDTQDVPKFTELLETTIHGLADVCRKSEAQQVYEVEIAMSVLQSNHINPSMRPICECFDCVLDTLCCEVFEK